MKSENADIIIIGTGSAFPTASYNACSAVRFGGATWLTDAGGGNGIFAALANAGVDVGEVTHFFVTHSHTDHILGAVWLMRGFINLAIAGQLRHRPTVYANSEAMRSLLTICRLTLLESHYRKLLTIADFRTVDEGSSVNFAGASVDFFNAGSENVAQTGFRMHFPSGKSFVCLGDEALTESNMPHAAGADLVLCGAFCRYADRDIFKPYEKHHYTVKDVAEVASRAAVGTLALYHSEDRTPDRQQSYAAEAAQYFAGRIIIPADGETINL